MRLAVVLGLAAVLVGCGSPAAPAPPGATAGTPAPTGQPAASGVRGEVIVFAASSLTDAFTEIGRSFEAAHPGSRVALSFGASSQLRTQLVHGARADVFASANQVEMTKARADGVIEGREWIFARNRLVVIVPAANPGGIVALRDLARPGLRLVTAAPEAPIGGYTQAMLDKMAADPAYGATFKERVGVNVVSREPNVRQVVAKVLLGEADAAVVYASDVTPDVVAKLRTLDVPDAFNTPAAYPLAVVHGAPDPAGAQAFVDYVHGAAGARILEQWGFLPGG